MEVYLLKISIVGERLMNNFDNIYVVSSLNGIVVFNFNNMKMLFLDKIELENFKNYLSGYESDFDDKYQFFLEEPELVAESIGFTLEPTISTGMACNYSCDYCYEKKYEPRIIQQIDYPMRNVDLFYMEYCKIYDKPFIYGNIAIIGGEPLLQVNEKILASVLERWKENKIIISTNGVNILELWDKIGKANIELHVSLDGKKVTHYKRRHTNVPYAYEKTIEGVKRAIEQGITVHIMSVFFPENKDEYSAFFDELENIGWLKYPNLYLNFMLKTNAGNDLYDIKYFKECIEAVVYLKNIDNRILRANITKMIPGISCFSTDKTMPKCSVFKCDKLYKPSYVFNPNGEVSVCTMTNSSKLVVGKCYPEIEINKAIIDTLQKRNILNMEKCINCKYALICRGGCLASSIESGGGILSPICGVWNTNMWMYGYDKLMW